MKSVKAYTHKKGMSLVQAAVAVTMLGIAATVMMSGSGGGSDLAAQKDTQEKLAKIDKAFRGYFASQKHAPCPSDNSLATNTANFGVAAPDAGVCNGSSPAANFHDGSHVVGGGLPVKTLNLPDEYAVDGWGNRFTYRVDRSATDVTTCAALGDGAIDVRATSGGANTRYAKAAIISHAKVAHGAFPSNGGSAITTGSTDVDTQHNASRDNGFAVAPARVTITVKKASDAGFDDIVWLGTPADSCTLGGAASLAAANCTLPWGGTINHGDNVTAYSAANGSPECDDIDETRTCNNGTLSGSFTHQSCLDGVAPPVEEDGGELEEGGEVDLGGGEVEVIP